MPPYGARPEAPAPATAAEKKITDRFDGRQFDWMGYPYDRQGYLRDPRDPWSTPPTQIFVVPREGGEPRKLTALDVDVRAPAWRPDGEALAFVADTHQRDEHTYERSDLWVVALDGALTRNTDDEYEYNSPAWSPDGRWIVVEGSVDLDVGIRERWDHGAPTDLWVFSADGMERRNITEEFDLQPGTSPDPVGTPE